MSIWENNDKNNYEHHVNNNIGQIDLNSQVGNFIYNCAINNNLKNYLEIGTWNGLGSTKCFIEGFKKRKSNYNFFSLECNKDKCNFAKELYSEYQNVHILNEVLLNNKPNDIYDIFPELKNNAMFEHWNNVDFDNMCDKPLFLNRNDIPKFFDVILLDGGEFTTWYEYLLLKDKCEILILDDSNVAKCLKIKEDIKNSNKWDIIFESNERNGTFACKKKYCH